MTTSLRSLSAVACLAVVAAAVQAPSATAGVGWAPAQVVVKVDLGRGHTIEEVVADHPIVVDSDLLASRGIYLVHGTRTHGRGLGQVKKLAAELAADPAVDYAEPNYVTSVADSQFHAWPDGVPRDAGSDPAVWRRQPAAAALRLPAAHALSRGSGVVVAVLDTGADASHPALAGRLLPGWNYVADTPQTSDVASGLDSNGNGHVDEAWGHGTFVSGTIAMVAPAAKILPERVLDSDGNGNVYLVAQAILDATDAHAQVINLSLGTADGSSSRLLADAVAYALAHGALVVAAAGNDRSRRPHYPAADRDVIGVTALAADGRGLADFADFGRWVDVAALGDRVVGPLPGGRYAWWSGTSVATPFVAGQAALVRATLRNGTPGAVRDAIQQTATRFGKHQVAFGRIDILASLAFARAHR
jgi:subtilisin family serine protease